MASGNNVAEHSPNYPESKGSSPPAAGNDREKVEKIFF
jgi:hypothetical protein